MNTVQSSSKVVQESDCNLLHLRIQHWYIDRYSTFSSHRWIPLFKKSYRWISNRELVSFVVDKVWLDCYELLVLVAWSEPM
jgi:hypothetical protein